MAPEVVEDLWKCCGWKGLKDVYHVNHNCFAVGVDSFLLQNLMLSITSVGLLHTLSTFDQPKY